MTTDTPKCFSPNLTTLVKLGSIVVHADEMISGDFHQFDRIAIESLLDDPEVKLWIKEMSKLALLPKKRK